MFRRPCLLLSIVLLVGCTTVAPISKAPTPASPATTPITTGPSGAAAVGLTAGLPACADDPAWRCGTVTVPVDRSDPSSAAITIHYYVLDRLDHSGPPTEPVFMTPGGPGASIWAQRDSAASRTWHDRHQTVLVDPRGVGASGAISCPALDAWLAGGMRPITDEKAVVAGCAGALGTNAGRYGNAERALDVEAVRAALGVEQFDYFGGSAASVDAQAYAVRFPQHLHALVLDSAFPAIETLEAGYPAMILRAVARQCARLPDCHTAFPDPTALLVRLVHAVATAPIRGDQPSPSAPGAADEATVAGLLLGGDPTNPEPLLTGASKALETEDPDATALLQLAAAESAPGDAADPSVFSWGDNAAVVCMGGGLAWAADSPLAGRAAKLAASFAALPTDAFAPFTRAGWLQANRASLDECLTWPPETRVDPPIPAGAAYPAVPTLVLAGDLDTGSPIEFGEQVANAFPRATFAIVHGAGHIASSPDWGPCGGELVEAFLDTLVVDQGRCASSDE